MSARSDAFDKARANLKEATADLDKAMAHAENGTASGSVARLVLAMSRLVAVVEVLIIDAEFKR